MEQSVQVAGGTSQLVRSSCEVRDGDVSARRGDAAVDGSLSYRYGERVQRVGGFKLALEGSGRDDRRVRFARVAVLGEGSHEETELVTDSRGRLRYPLPAGDYRLRVVDGGTTQFTVTNRRWTMVRLELP